MLKSFVKKFILNNLGYKLLAAVFAFVLWLVILNIQDPEYTRTINNIQVNIENEELIMDGTHVYTVASGGTTSVTVTGKRSIISTMTQEDISATANFAELSITNAVPIEISITGSKARYASQISLVAKDTNMLINLEEMTEKSLAVETRYSGTEPEGMIIEEANIYPRKVTLSAPRSIADAADIAVVKINYQDIGDGETVNGELLLYSEEEGFLSQNENVSLDVETVSVEFKVSYYKQVAIEIDAGDSAAEGFEIDSVEISQDSIALKGSMEDIEKLDHITIPSQAFDQYELTDDLAVELDVTPYLPEGISVYGESPTVIINLNIVKTAEENER